MPWSEMANPTQKPPASPYHPRAFSAWGGIKREAYPMAAPLFRDEVAKRLAARPTPTVLGIGLGRSYGISNTLSGGSLIEMVQLDRIIAFDREKGVLRAEAGLSLSEILRVIVPHGWFLPTTPGSRFVTLGGAVANDVHGKNHHRAGSFGCSVTAIGLMRSDGTELELSEHGEPGLFAATIGGLGLTGLIVWVEIKLSRIPGTSLACERTAFGSLREFQVLAKDADERFEHFVAWIDCASTGTDFGRGIFEAGNWTPGGLERTHDLRPKIAIPLDAPGFLISGPTVKAFNALYFKSKRAAAGPYTQHYGGFFYPLDVIDRWNRLYGRKGFYQYQCVVPYAGGIDAIDDMLRLITKSGNASFLAVLKTFGAKASPGMLSFPAEGITLALDFPNHGHTTLSLFAELDKIVGSTAGRLYPAKDARMPRRMFEAGYARLDEFRTHVDPAFSSDFWKAMNS
jgi:FAD/FMN-containing dehydrogenase